MLAFWRTLRTYYMNDPIPKLLLPYNSICFPLTLFPSSNVSLIVTSASSTYRQLQLIRNMNSKMMFSCKTWIQSLWKRVE